MKKKQKPVSAPFDEKSNWIYYGALNIINKERAKNGEPLLKVPPQYAPPNYPPGYVPPAAAKPEQPEPTLRKRLKPTEGEQTCQPASPDATAAPSRKRPLFKKRSIRSGT